MVAHAALFFASQTTYQLVNFFTTPMVRNSSATMMPKSLIMDKAVGAVGNSTPTTRANMALSRSTNPSRAACRPAGIVTVGHLL